MKTIVTHLTEQAFLDRLDRFCRPKTKSDKEYLDIDTFVCFRKEKNFWIGRHHAHGGRSDGFANDRINGTYRVEDSGHVTVSYRFGKHPALLLFHVVLLVIGIPMAVSVLIDAMNHSAVSWHTGLMALFFMIFGVVGFFGSGKEKAAQEEHLKYICGVAEAGEEIVPAERVDVSHICDGDVYPLCVEYGGVSYLTLHYYTENGDGLLHDDHSIICFRDELQMNRFCLSHDLTAVADTVTYHFDDSVTDACDHDHILNRWNLLNTVAEMLSLTFEGNDHAHDELYELLFAMSLPADGETAFADFDEGQMAELEKIFAEQDDLLSHFRMYHE